jgi:predicted Zn-dependent protease
MFSRVKFALLALSASLAISACAPTAQNTAQSLAAERRAAEQHAAKLDQAGKLVKTRGLNNYVQGIVDRITKTRPAGTGPVKSYIVADADVNAYTAGGNIIFIHTALLAAMENEAQFANVVAHEIAHIDRGHIQAARASRQGVQIGAAAASIGGALLGVNPNLTNTLVNVGANAFVSNFSRTQETDADNTGIQYMARAGYNGLEGARSFEVLRTLYGDGGGFLASHPASSQRQANLSAQARQLGATKGRIAEKTYDKQTRRLRQDMIKFYDSRGRQKEASLLRRNLR